MKKLIMEVDLENPEFFKCELINDDVRTIKNISLNQLVHFLGDCTDTSIMSKYTVPDNCLGISFSGDYVYCTVLVKKRVIPAKYAKADIENNYLLPYPNLIFTFKINEYKSGLEKSWCFAVKDDVVTENTEIFEFPFSNVSKGKGVICYGGNNTLYNGDLRQSIEEYLETFFIAPYNGDYYTMDRTAFIEKLLQELMNKLNGKKEFPLDKLVSTGKSFKDITFDN